MSCALKYSKKREQWENATKTNTWDGFEARSYDWYVYAYKIGEQLYMVDKSYSNTTSKHMSCLRELLKYPQDTKYVLAPEGLNNLGASIKAIDIELGTLIEALKNPKVRSRHTKLERVNELQIMRGDVEALHTELAKVGK